MSLELLPVIASIGTAFVGAVSGMIIWRNWRDASLGPVNRWSSVEWIYVPLSAVFVFIVIAVLRPFEAVIGGAIGLALFIAFGASPFAKRLRRKRNDRGGAGEP